jgi:UDP-glucose:(glucosyl)LPS alpha-1,3-glucosyltransferase
LRSALVTVSSDEFIEGTVVLFHSFIENNKWFKGDFIVINGGLSDVNIHELKNEFKCYIVNPSVYLSEKIEQLIECIPAYFRTQKRFYSLEVFNIRGYDKLLFLDSDIVCLRNVETLFKLSDALLACPDQRFFQNFVRDRTTLLPIPRSAIKSFENKKYIEKFFNTGMFFINKSIMEDDFFNRLISALIPENYQFIKTGHTDTVVLNKILLEQVNWLPIEYNYYTSLPTDEKISPYFVHFIGKDKPWKRETNRENYWVKKWLSYYD